MQHSNLSGKISTPKLTKKNRNCFQNEKIDFSSSSLQLTSKYTTVIHHKLTFVFTINKYFLFTIPTRFFRALYSLSINMTYLQHFFWRIQVLHIENDRCNILFTVTALHELRQHKFSSNILHRYQNYGESRVS